MQLQYTTIIPAHNEEAFIGQMLESLARQSARPAKVVVVDDNSTDRTAAVALSFRDRFRDLAVIRNESGNEHLPGSKVIRAFERGLRGAGDFDIIVKLDADLILPPDYFEKILDVFASNPAAGMAGGFATIEKDGRWVIENLTDKDHIRGAFKAYRKNCFDQIGGLRPAMGWDTIDELLARYHGWEVVTLPDLLVKHLKPTGASYGKEARFKQGAAFYRLGYGFWITAIASAKLAIRKGNYGLFVDYISGYLKALQSGEPLLVDREQAKWIRRYRWKKMKSKLF